MLGPMQIDFASGVSCPWCVIGLLGLEQALADVGDLGCRTGRRRALEQGWEQAGKPIAYPAFNRFPDALAFSMARATKLKLYRTVAGFHDAYVAASSQKAALAAWGSDKDLFARGLAEQVTDEALAAEALAAPGTVIRRSRGTTAEQIAALPPDPTAATAEQAANRTGPRCQAEPNGSTRRPFARSSADSVVTAIAEAQQCPAGRSGERAE